MPSDENKPKAKWDSYDREWLRAYERASGRAQERSRIRPQVKSWLAPGGAISALIIAIATALKPSAEAGKVDDQSWRLKNAEARLNAAESRISELETYQREFRAAQQCRNRQLGDVAWRSGYRLDWSSASVRWVSERLQRDEELPAFRADEECPRVPQAPGKAE